jgi:hypothetical protein
MQVLKNKWTVIDPRMVGVIPRVIPWTTVRRKLSIWFPELEPKSPYRSFSQCSKAACELQCERYSHSRTHKEVDR